MSREQSPKPEIIKEIFERKKRVSVSKKKVSTLFGASASDAAKDKGKPERRRLPREFFPVGIDIGSSGIKAVQLARNDGQLQLAKIADKSSPNPLRRFAQSEKSLIKDLIQENSLSGEAVLGLSARDVGIHTLRLPAMPAQELYGAIRWEMGQILKTSARRMDDYSLDYDVLGESSKENEILVAAVLKEVVMEKVREVKEAGLNVTAAEPNPLALFAGLSYFSPPESDDVTLLLDIGYEISYACMAVGKDVYFVQSVSTTGNLLTEAVRDYFQIEHNDAEELKRRYGLENWSSMPEALVKVRRMPQRQETGAADASVSEEINSLKPALASGLENLVVDIEHSYKYLCSKLLRLGERPLSRIMVCGGGGRLKGLDDFLRSRFDVHVEVFNPLSGVIIEADLRENMELEESATAFGVAVGLALRGV